MRAPQRLATYRTDGKLAKIGLVMKSGKAALRELAREKDLATENENL